MNETLLGSTDQSQPQVDPNKDYLAELVGEGRKFKTAQEMARGKYEADLYIKMRDRQYDELRTDYLKLREDSTARAKLEELIGQLEAKQTQQHSNSEQPKLPEVNDKPGLDHNELKSLVSSSIQEYEMTKRQQDNFNKVKDRLKEQFGDNYQNVLKSQSEELGLTEEDINTLARKSPNAFFKTLGIEQAQTKESFQAPFASSQKPETFKPKGPQKRTMTYYQELKKTQPNLYLDPKINVQMHNDAVALGEAFFDAD